MACGLFNLMENFILREVDYSQQYGYSERAKRFMRRKLNKELEPYIQKDEPDVDSDSNSCSDSGSDIGELYKKSVNASVLLPSHRVEFCVFVGYLCVVATFYAAVASIVNLYLTNQCPNN
jgi:hypothetical protein